MSRLTSIIHAVVSMSLPYSLFFSSPLLSLPLLSSPLLPQSSSCLLDPSDTAHYSLISKAFLAAQTKAYGPTHYYAFDQFNEMEPPAGSTYEYLGGVSKAAFDALRDYDAKATWVMQVQKRTDRDSERDRDM